MHSPSPPLHTALPASFPPSPQSSQDSPLVTPPLALTAPHRVLLLVSCQRGALVGPHAMPCAPRLRHNLSIVLAAARGADPAPLIVHVRNAGAPGDVDEVGQPGWELWTDPREGELVLDKHKGSAWWGTGLADRVSPRAEVVVVGCASDYCIRDTCRDAAERKNTVLLIHGAHGAYDRPAIFGAGVAIPADAVEREVEDALDSLGVIMMDMEDVPGIFHDR